MSLKINEIIEGCLLGDGCIFLDRKKYSRFKLTAKDRDFLEWVKQLLIKKFKVYISFDKRNRTHILYSSSNPFFTLFREKWYKKIKGRIIKTIPRDLELSPATLLFWYLGDGSLVRRKNDSTRVPFIVLATNNFLKEDIDFLIQKLKELNLNFYSVKYKSGFTGKPCGYCLYSKTQDGTPFRFFKLIGLECPKEIARCSTGRKGKYGELKFFKDKWPTEEDWIKILSNVKIGKILRKRRLELGLTQAQLAEKVGVRREMIRDVELEKRNLNVKNFRKILNVLDLHISNVLKAA